MRSNSSVVIPACVATTSWGQSLHTRRPQRRLVVFEHRLKRLGGAPFRVLRCERLDTVQGEGELDVERLLGPERPIVVEDGDARWRAARSRDRSGRSRLGRRCRQFCFASPSFQDGSGSAWAALVPPMWASLESSLGAMNRPATMTTASEPSRNRARQENVGMCLICVLPLSQTDSAARLERREPYFYI